MPLVTLEPGKSISLSPNEDPNDPDAVSNPNAEEGQYTMDVNNDAIAVVQKFIPPGGYQPFLSPLPNGLTIGNNGDVTLQVKTPGE